MDNSNTNEIPEWDVLTTTSVFNMKIFYSLVLMVLVYVLNIIITAITVINTNKNSLPEIGLFFITSTIVSFIITIFAIVLAHKGLKEIKSTRQKGRFFAYGVLSAGYISVCTLGIVFIIMDIMFIMLYTQ